MHLTEEDENNIQTINEFKVTWFTLLSRVDAAPTVDEIVLTSLNHVANLIMCRKGGNSSKDLVFEMALSLCVFETLFQWNFVFTGADLEAYKVRELQFYDSLIGNNGELYLSHEGFVIPFMATMHHCSLRSCLLVERALVRLLNTVCAILSAQFKPGVIQNTLLQNMLNGDEHIKDNTPTGCSNGLLLFRRMCMGVVDLSQINSHLNNNNNDENITNVNLEQFNFNPGLVSLKTMESIDWAMCLECNKVDSDTEKHTAFSCDFEESPSFNDNSNRGLPTIDSICDLLAPYIFRDGDLGWQARDSLLLIAAYSLRDEEFSHSIAKYSSICAVIATGLGMLYTALPHRLVNNNSPETWPILIRTLDTNQEANTRFTEFLGALDFCRSLLEIAHPLIQSCLLHCIHAIFFVSVIGPALTQRAAEDVITATVYLEQFIIHTVGSSLLPILLRFLLMKLPSHTVLDSNSPMTHPTVGDIDTSNNQGSSTESSPISEISQDNMNPSEFFTESSDHWTNDNILTSVNSSTSSTTYMDLIIARIHQCNSLLGITTLSLMNTIIDLHCEDVMFVLVLKHLISVRDSLFSIGWTWPDASSLTNTSTKILDLSSTKFDHITPGYDNPSHNNDDDDDDIMSKITLNKKMINHNCHQHVHYSSQHQNDNSTGDSNPSNAIAQLDIDDMEEYTSGSSLTHQEISNNEGLEALGSKSESIVEQLDNLPVGGQFLASHLLIPHTELTTNSLIMNNYGNDLHIGVTDHVNNTGNTGNLTNFSQQTGQELSYKLSNASSSSPSYISNNFSSNNSSPVLINSPNPMLDWLSYTSWAHQTIKIRKYACKTWQLTFDAVQPTIEQINLLDENLKNLKMTEKEFTCYQKTRKFSEYDCRIGLDPYKIYTDYKCFVTRNCCPFLEDIKMKANELHAKALCTAATKLNIETDLDLADSDNMDECETTINNCNYKAKPQQKYYQEQLPTKQPHKNGSNSTTSLKHALTTSNSADQHLCSMFTKCKETSKCSSGSLHHDHHAIKSYDKTLIKSWYHLNFLDSFDACEQLTTNNGDNILATHDDPTDIEKDNSASIETNSTENSYELSQFIEELENIPSESLTHNSNNSQKPYEENTNQQAATTPTSNKCGSLSCLDDHTDETYRNFDNLLEQLRATSLLTLPMQFTDNYQEELFDVPLTIVSKQCSSQEVSLALSNNETLNADYSRLCCNKNTNQTNGTSKDNLCSNHHHRGHDYCEAGFTHGSLNNLIQARSNDSSSAENNDYGSPSSLVTIPRNVNQKMDNHLTVLRNEDHSPCRIQPPSSLSSSPSKVAVICSKKRLSISTVSSTISSAYLETIQHLSQNTCKESLGYNGVDFNVNNTTSECTAPPIITTTNTTNNSTHEKDMDSLTTHPNLGPFLTTLLNRLENFTNNCFYANLYLTNLVSSLASYPVPLLRAMLFLTNTSNLSQNIMINSQSSLKIRALHDDVLRCLPYNILCLIKKQIDLFAVLYTRQCKYFGLLNTLNGYSFSELKQEARRYLNYETIDPSKLPPVSATSMSGVESKKKRFSDSNNSHKEPRYLSANKQDISPMMNSNKRFYFRKWFNLSSKTNIKNTSSNNTVNNNKTNKNTDKNGKSSSSNTLNLKDLIDFSQILQKPMSQFTLPTDLDDNQQLINGLSLHNSTSPIINSYDSYGSGNGNHRRKSFRLSTRKQSKLTSVNYQHTKQNRIVNEDDLPLDIPRIQRMVLCAVIFEDFCKELAAICTEHSIQW
ncbi:unnamed protein product [Heterobilharzia americana]|nr:unnamed protein product [Heterobilharzia americana]